MMQWILDNIFTIMTTIFGGTSIFALIVEKNKRRIEEKQLSADALTKMQDAYKVFTQDATDSYTKLKEEMESKMEGMKKKLDIILQDLNKERAASNQANAENIVLKKENEALNYELKECKENL